MNNIFLNLNLDKFLLGCYSREQIKVLMGLGLELGVETSKGGGNQITSSLVLILI